MNMIKDTKLYPSDWEVKKLGELGTFLRGKGISKSETKESGLPCIRYGEIYTRHHDYIKEFYSFVDEGTANKSTEIMKGDILFAGSGETAEEIGKSVAYLHEDKAYAGGDIIILRTKDVNSKYLAFALNEGRLAKERAKLGQGHSVVHIYPKELKELIIHLPSDIEQQKIASILSTWDKAIELKEKLIEQKKEQKKGLMQKLLTGEVRLPGFDGEWQEVALGEITDISTGKKDNQDKVEYGKYPFFVRSENVERINSYSFDGEAILIPGDGRIGQIYHYIVGKFDYHQRVYKISDFSEISSGKFIYFYLSQFFHKEAIRYSAKATVDSLRLPMLTGMKIKLPALAEQNEIVGVLNIVDKEISLLEENLIYLKRQKQGLMQLLLTGKVRVKV